MPFQQDIVPPPLPAPPPHSQTAGATKLDERIFRVPIDFQSCKQCSGFWISWFYFHESDKLFNRATPAAQRTLNFDSALVQRYLPYARLSKKVPRNGVSRVHISLKICATYVLPAKEVKNRYFVLWSDCSKTLLKLFSRMPTKFLLNKTYVFIT